jgi:hypothetical protein
MGHAITHCFTKLLAAEDRVVPAGAMRLEHARRQAIGPDGRACARAVPTARRARRPAAPTSAWLSPGLPVRSASMPWQGIIAGVARLSPRRTASDRRDCDPIHRRPRLHDLPKQRHGGAQRSAGAAGPRRLAARRRLQRRRRNREARRTQEIRIDHRGGVRPPSRQPGFNGQPRDRRD